MASYDPTPALEAALRTLSETDVACHLEPPEHAEEWSDAIIVALRAKSHYIVNAELLAEALAWVRHNGGSCAHGDDTGPNACREDADLILTYLSGAADGE